MIHEVLENGVEVVLKQNRFTPAVAVQAWVGVGSLHEQPAERGMAHFLEHMLFKGTERREVGEIAATVEACGGDVNAYTTFDQTVFYLTLAAEHAGLGVDLLCDAFAHSTLAPVEFEREREVILEEIKRSNDSPGARIGRRVFELAFSGSEAGRPILGSEASVRAFARDEVYAFYRRWYTPGNLTVIVVGDFDDHEMLEQVKKTFGNLPAQPRCTTLPSPVPGRPAREAQWPRVSLIHGDFQQPRLEVVYPAAPLAEVDSTALDLAAFALGAGELARLNLRLRDGEGVVSSVGASVYTPLFSGLFEVSALASLEQMPAAVTAIAREVAILHGVEPVSAVELQRARAVLKADRVSQEETVDGQARTLGFGMRTAHKLLYDDVYTAMVNAMPDAAVSSAVRRWLKPQDATIVALLPLNATLTAEELRTAFHRGVQAAAAAAESSAQVPASLIPVSQSPAAHVIQLKPGIKLIYRHNPNVELFTMTAATEGGLRGETAANAGIYHALFAMLGLASEAHDYNALMHAVEGLGASLEGFSGKDSAGFHLQCLTEHAKTMLGLFGEVLLTPVFPEAQWQPIKREIEQALAAQEDSPSGVCIRRFQERLYGNHPYCYPLIGKAEAVAHFTPQLLQKFYAQLVSSGPWVIAVASTLPVEAVVKLVSEALGGFNPEPTVRRFSSVKTPQEVRPGPMKIAKDREQAHLVYGFRGLTWDDPDRYALDLLITILGGHGGRLFKELRDKNSLAYTVSPIVTYGCHPGIIGSYIACAPEKTSRALAALEEEMMALTREVPSSGEVERARSYIIGSHEMGLQRSDAQTSTMALMELYGYGFTDFLTYPEHIKQVTAADVMRVAKRLFLPEKAVTVEVGPEGERDASSGAQMC